MGKALRLLVLIAILTGTEVLTVKSQAVLKPSIGLNAIPRDTAPICQIPLAIDPTELFDAPGLHEGDTVPDFRLYTLNDDSVQLSQLLSDRQPVLLVGGSYTCPKYRNHLNELNDLEEIYGTRVHLFIIYTVEAHPDSPDISPYKGQVWQLNSNEKDGIHYHEPVTYLDRKNAASDMIQNLDIREPVLLDGPCNAWWESFALAPNPVFLINPNGTIFKKQGWFDNGLYAISYAIDSLLQKIVTGVHDEGRPSAVVNLSSSNIDFIFSKPLENAHLMIFDALGRLAAAPALFSGTVFELQKGNLPNGIYFYSIQSLRQSLSGTMIIQ